MVFRIAAKTRSSKSGSEFAILNHPKKIDTPLEGCGAIFLPVDYCASRRGIIMKTHLTVALTQAAVDKVLGDIHYPVTVYDKHTQFDRTHFGDEQPEDYSQQKFEQTLNLAKQRGVDAAQLSFEMNSLRADIEQVETSKKHANKHGEKWVGPSDDELDAWKKYKFKVRAHLAWFRIIIDQRPSISVRVPETPVKNISTLLSATGEMWVYRPKLRCTKSILGFCYRWEWVYVWELWLSVTASSVKAKGAGVIDWSADNFVLVGSPHFTDVRLDYPILRDLQLKKLVKLDPFDVVSAKKLTAAVPYVDKHYHVTGVETPAGAELRLNIEFAK
jgi:hypothetical protein